MKLCRTWSLAVMLLPLFFPVGSAPAGLSGDDTPPMGGVGLPLDPLWLPPLGESRALGAASLASFQPAGHPPGGVADCLDAVPLSWFQVRDNPAPPLPNTVPGSCASTSFLDGQHHAALIKEARLVVTGLGSLYIYDVPSGSYVSVDCRAGTVRFWAAHIISVTGACSVSWGGPLDWSEFTLWRATGYNQYGATYAVFT